jgi:hypothetical protein
MAEEKHKGRREVYWTTVTYRTLILYGALVLGVILATLYLIYPNWFDKVFRRASAVFERQGSRAASPALSQARFINLDGNVEVQKLDSARWIPADYRMALERGDKVKTGSDGVARITFADGSTYTVKTDTLITVEENSMAGDRTTRVAVSITTGTLDLTTSIWEAPGSKVEVAFEDAVASLHQNSRAAVRTDPTKKQHEIVLAAGGAELQRGDQRVSINPFERVSFSTGGPINKTRVLAPPDLVGPINFQPIFVPDPKHAAVNFDWKPVAGAATYKLRISRNSMFSHVLSEQHTREPRASVRGLEEGDYFWNVAAIDSQNHESESSDTYKFTLVPQNRRQGMRLEIEGTQLHGNVVEVIGLTEPGAAIIINGQPVANIQNDGRFHHFTEPLARGSQTIVVIGQNRRGGSAEVKKQILIP